MTEDDATRERTRTLTAGAFARRSRLSPKALRLYAERDLLVPAEIDPRTGYRRYRVAQLHDARLIGLLRRAGLSLDDVHRVLRAARSDRAAIVRTYWAQAEREHERRRRLIGHITRTISDGKDSSPMHTIDVRDVPEFIALTEQAHITAAGLRDWIIEAGLRQLAAAEAVGGPAGPRTVVYHGEVTEDSDGPVESLIPISGASTVITAPVRVEPAHREVYTSVTRAQVRFPDILTAYDALESWMGANGRPPAGSPREIYLADPSSGPDDEIVAEVAWPIA